MRKQWIFYRNVRTHLHQPPHGGGIFPAPVSFVVAVSFGGFLGLVWLIAPAPVWAAQVSGPFWKLLAAFLGFSLFNCFMEFFFHRYVLHKPVAPFLSYFYKQHTHHHSLTRITRRRTPGGLEVNFVENFYPILEKEQKEASFFPGIPLSSLRPS